MLIKMKPVLKKCIDVGLPLSISVVMIIWLFHKVNLSAVGDALNHGCRWGWFFVMMVVLILSHVIRGIRWGIQLRGAGLPRIPVLTESVSIFGAYALNMLFSYLGEAWRCVYISKITRSKVTTVVGTDLGDRASDAVVVVCLVILSMFVARPAMESFLDKYEVGRKLTAAMTDGSFWLWFVALIVVIAGCCRMVWNMTWFRSVRAGIERMWKGFAVLFHMKGGLLYVVLTLGIWTCYFMETYLCFQAFPFTRQLVSTPGLAWGLIPGLVVFVFGSCSIAIPSSGGLGPWNLAVMFALQLYGVSQSDAAAYALVVWAWESGTLILLGVFSAIYVSLQRHYNFGLPKFSHPQHEIKPKQFLS